MVVCLAAHVFNGVMSLCKVCFPEKGQFTIGQYTFYNTGLKEITLPAGVHRLERWHLTVVGIMQHN